ncbi:MAG: hypothetical protein KC491_01225 [Dehalococcoidia bacterium]|nr:hypothetical protein [Dehalococcoidia bacterium]
MAARVISIHGKDPKAPPWKELGFESERDMLIDDLKNLDRRIKSADTAAHAISALSKRKQEVYEQIKQLDNGSDPANILDDSEDEAWDAQG